MTVLAETANVSKACDGAGVGRSAMYSWRREDQEFAAKWDEAMDVGVGALEDEAHRRAFEGCDEPVYYLGQKVDTVKKYSDTLAIFLLKAHRPEKYRERVENILAGDKSRPLYVDRIERVVVDPK